MSVIKVENLSKQYRLTQVGTGTLSHDVNRWWHSLRGKGDPYLKIGDTNDRTIKGESDYVWALKDINFDVQQGEVLGIVGRNGAGKSTLLKILSRTTAPTKGFVKIKGRVASLLEVGTGFHPELTGRENIYLNGSILGMSKEYIKNKLDEIIDFSGVERYIDIPVKRYSSGMYVRLAFAVAAHLESEILIVDEVLAVGDIEFQAKCLGKMSMVSQSSGKTIIFVSHNLEAIKKLCSRGILINNGTLVSIGGIDKVYFEYLKDINKHLKYQKAIVNHNLSDSFKILSFQIDRNIIDPFSDFNFELKLESIEVNPFDSLSLLIYDSIGDRIAIIDLRSVELFEKTKINNRVTIKGIVNSIPFVFGDYTLGLAIGSKIFTGDVLHLINFTVTQKNISKGQTQYPKSSLGKIYMEYTFNYE